MASRGASPGKCLILVVSKTLEIAFLAQDLHCADDLANALKFASY